MEYTSDDIFLSKICMLREDELGGIVGMTAVCWSQLNRAIYNKYSLYKAITAKWAYSSINCPGMSNEPAKNRPLVSMQEELQRLYKKVNTLNSYCVILSKFANPDNPAEWKMWQQLDVVARNVFSQQPGVVDPIKGSTLYHAASMNPYPTWALNTKATTFQVAIGGHRYYTETRFNNVQTSQNIA